MSATRILVTCAGGSLAPLNIRLLRESRRHDIWVAAVDVNEDAVGRYFADEFATVPPGDGPGYVEAIVDLVTRHKIELIMPWSDEEALSLAQARDQIEATGARLLCNRAESIAIMRDKGATYATLASHDVPVADWVLADSAEALAEHIDRFAHKGDFAVKPSVSRGNRNVFVVRGDVSGAKDYLGSREVHVDPATFRRDYLADLGAHLPVVVSERLYPPAYDIDILARDGEVMRAIPRKRLNPAGVPYRGGVIENRRDLLDIAAGVTRALNLSWLFDCDIMTKGDGSPVVLELNPRPSGSVAAAILAGVPVYDDLISLTKGEPISDTAVPDGAAVVPYIDCKLVSVSELP